MSIRPISQADFDQIAQHRNPFLMLMAEEKAWYASTNREVVGVIVFDKTDSDWNFVILGPHADGYRAVDWEGNFESKRKAEERLRSLMSEYEQYGKRKESLYESAITLDPAVEATVIDINQELKRLLSNQPEELYKLTPRRFEELIASVMSRKSGNLFGVCCV